MLRGAQTKPPTQKEHGGNSAYLSGISISPTCVPSTVYTMHWHSEAKACQSQLLPCLLLVSRRNREQRPTRTSQQKAAIFLHKQNTLPLTVKIFPLQHGFIIHKHCASGQLFIQCPQAEQKGNPRGPLAEETSAHL